MQGLSYLFDQSFCMYPGCKGSRKSEMSMLPSYEPLTIDGNHQTADHILRLSAPVVKEVE